MLGNTEDNEPVNSICQLFNVKFKYSNFVHLQV